jgi:hypothetical protein
MSVIFVFIWLFFGFASFVFWFTKDHDITTHSSDMIHLLAGGALGPISFIFGGLIHIFCALFIKNNSFKPSYNRENSSVLFRRRYN